LAPTPTDKSGTVGRARPAVTEDLRRNNLASLVRHLHLSGPLSRSNLTVRTGLNRSTIGDLVGELSAVGLVQETAPPSRAGAGRPSLVVSLGPGRVWALSIELAPETLVAARVAPGGRIEDRLAFQRDWQAHLAPEMAASVIADLARELIARAPRNARLVGAAAAVPGIVRREDGFVHLAPNLLWREAPFGSLLSGHLSSPHGVVVANEADLAALAESTRGAAVGCPNSIYISGNTGVGAGIIVQGSLLAGRSGYAGEVGHMKVNPGGRRCHCGGRGCWETEIGAAAILRRAGRKSKDLRPAVLQVLEDAGGGDAAASKAVRETVQWIGRGTADLINIFNPDLVVFGGNLREVVLASQRALRTEVRRHALPQAGAEANIVVSALGPDAALLGAAELGFSRFLADPVGVLAAAG
jgi:predicted NBD/HSP70 family sugar kinase